MQFRGKTFALGTLLIAVGLSALFLLLPPADNVGSSAGPESANVGLRPQTAVTSLAFDPLRAATVYAGSTGRAGLWVSQDDGRSWHAEKGPVSDQPVYALLASRSQPGKLLAATGRGLYERARDGANWERVAAVPGAPLYALAEDEAGGLLAAGSGPAVYRRRPGAATWEASGPLPFPPPEPPDSPEVSGPRADAPAAGAVLALAVGAHGQILAGTDGRGLFTSDDDGQTWRNVPGIPRTYVAALKLAPDGTGLARTRAGLFQTGDGGATWHATATDIDERIDALAGPRPGVFLIGTGAGDLYQSVDGGTGWQRFGSGIGRGGLFFVLSPVPSQPDRWLAGRESGLYESEDGGLTWRAAEHGPGYPAAETLAAGASGTLFLGTGDGVYRSSDGGASWEPGSRGLPPTRVLAIGVSPANPRTLFAGLDGVGLYRSNDGGSSWQPTNWRGPTVPGIALDPRDPEHLYIRVAFERVYESRDGGKTWGARWTGLGLHTQVTALEMDPADPASLYAGATEGLFGSQDGGTTWHSLDSPSLAGQTVFCLAAGASPGELYAGTTEGIYHTRGAGQRWERWGRQLADVTVSALAFPAGQSGRAYAGTRYNGLWVTADRGQTWQPAGPGTEGLSILSLVFSPDGRWLLAATDAGVYRVPVR